MKLKKMMTVAVMATMLRCGGQPYKTFLWSVLVAVMMICGAHAESYTVAPGVMTYHEGVVQVLSGSKYGSNSYYIQVPDGQYAKVTLLGGKWLSYHCFSAFSARLGGYGKLKFGETVELSSSATLSVEMVANADIQAIPYGTIVEHKIGLGYYAVGVPSYRQYDDYRAQQEYTLSVSYAKKLPDISVRAVSLSSAAVAVDETASISFEIYNGGWLGTGADFVARIYDGTRQIGGDLTIPALGRNASSSRSVALPKLAAGTHKIRVVADATGRVNEASESNNETTMSLRVYTRTPVSVTYNLNGGGASQVASVVAGNLVGALPDVARKGYDFCGWWTEVSGGKQLDSTEKITESRTFYAHWRARATTISLNRQYGGQGTRTVTATFDQSMPRIAVPSRPGFVFGGYWSKPDGVGTQYYSSSGASVHLWDVDAPQMVLYAKWTGSSISISLDRCGGVGGSASTTAEYASPLPSVVPPTRSGWNFQGYFSETNGTGVLCYSSDGSAAAICTFKNAVMLYAHWLPVKMDYALTLDLQGGRGVGFVTARYSASMPSITPPERDKYVFRGYYSETGGRGKKYYNENGSAAALWDSVSIGRLYAYWEKAYHVVLNANVAGTTPTVQYFTTDRWELVHPSYSRSGYVFAGWALRPDGPPVFPRNAVLSKEALGYGDDPDAEEVVLYAAWGKTLSASLPSSVGGASYCTGGDSADSGWSLQDGALRSALMGGESWICAAFEGCGDLSVACTNVFFNKAVLDFSFFTEGHLYTNRNEYGCSRDVSTSAGRHLAVWTFRKSLAESGWDVHLGSGVSSSDAAALQAAISAKEARFAEIRERVSDIAVLKLGGSYSEAKIRAAVAEAFSDCRANISIGDLWYYVAEKVRAAVGTNKLRTEVKNFKDNGIDTGYMKEFCDGCAEAAELAHDMVGVEEYLASGAILAKVSWKPSRQVGFLREPLPDYTTVQNAFRETERLRLVYADLKDPIADQVTWLLTPAGYSFTDANRETCRQAIRDCLEDCWSGANGYGAFVRDAVGNQIGCIGVSGLRTSNYYGALSGSVSDTEARTQGRQLNALYNTASGLLSEKEQLCEYLSRNCGVVEMRRLAEGARIGTLPTLGDQTGLSFKGWRMAETGSSVSASTVVNGDIVLLAIWSTNAYNVVFKEQGGTAFPPQEVEYGKPIGILPVPSRDGYSFEGWYADSSCSSAIDPYSPVESSLTVYAGWTKEYDLDAIVDSAAVKSGSSFNWTDEPTSGSDDGSGSSSGAAAWTVTFNANGGSGAAEYRVEKGKAVGTLPTPEREGFAFLGWFTAASGGTKISVSTKVTKDVTYYAHWQYQGAADDSTIVFETEEEYTTAGDGSFTLNLSEVIGSTSVPKVTVKGLPSGLKFDAKTLTISGAATKPGVYTVTVSVTNATVKKAVTATFEIVVPNLSCDALSGLMPETDAYGVIRCGVAFDPALVDCTSEDGWTVKVAGLPAGLKYDAKTGTITGVPTKAGTFTVTFTATKKGEKNQTATITLKTEALPAWAVGSFAGVATEPDGSGSAGAASMSVTEVGKISGKFAIGGTNWTFSAVSYVECDADYGYAEVTAKAGRLARTFTIEVSPCESPDGTLVNAEALASIEDESIDLHLYRNMWKDKATAAAAKSLLQGMTGVYTASISAGDDYGAGYLSFTVSATGDAKASGKLADGTSVSSSVPLWWDGDGYEAWFAATPSAYKGGGVEVRIAIPQERGMVESGYCNWASRSPTATGEYGEGFARESGVVCAYYDKTKTLDDCGDAFSFSAEQPTLNGVEPLDVGEVEITIDANGKPVIDKASGLTLSFAQATGVFKGGYTFVFGEKTKKKVSFEGIWVQGTDLLEGFYLWDATGYYDDPKSGKEKSYKYKESHGVRLAP